MSAKIDFSLCKPNIPKGAVLIEDLALISQGLYDTIAHIVQVELGYSGSIRLKEESKHLISIALTKIDKGSAVLRHEVLPVNGTIGRPPAAIGALNIVDAVNNFNNTGNWPKYFPSYIRNKLGVALDPVIDEKTTAKINVIENGKSFSCDINNSITYALKKIDPFSVDIPIEIVGKIYDINMYNNSFKIDTDIKKITVEIKPEQRTLVDNLRWQRVFVTGYPADGKCSRLSEMKEIREATPEEENGILSESEAEEFIAEMERSSPYKYVKNRIDEFLTYDTTWDSHQATAPSKSILQFALNFFEDAYSTVIQHELLIPNVFVVPTLNGGIQFEWEVADRELELEVISINNFKYLKIDSAQENEGDASRWEAIRLIRWVITGEAL